MKYKLIGILVCALLFLITNSAQAQSGRTANVIRAKGIAHRAGGGAYSNANNRIEKKQNRQAIKRTIPNKGGENSQGHKNLYKVLDKKVGDKNISPDKNNAGELSQEEMAAAGKN